MLKFKQAIAEQLSKHVSTCPNKIIKGFKIPNKRKQGDLSISMFDLDPSLKKSGQQLPLQAQAIITKVRPLRKEKKKKSFDMFCLD